MRRGTVHRGRCLRQEGNRPGVVDPRTDEAGPPEQVCLNPPLRPRLLRQPLRERVGNRHSQALVHGRSRWTLARSGLKEPPSGSSRPGATHAKGWWRSRRIGNTTVVFSHALSWLCQLVSIHDAPLNCDAICKRPPACNLTGYQQLTPSTEATGSKPNASREHLPAISKYSFSGNPAAKAHAVIRTKSLKTSIGKLHRLPISPTNPTKIRVFVRSSVHRLYRPRRKLVPQTGLLLRHSPFPPVQIGPENTESFLHNTSPPAMESTLAKSSRTDDNYRNPDSFHCLLIPFEPSRDFTRYHVISLATALISTST